VQRWHGPNCAWHCIHGGTYWPRCNSLQVQMLYVGPCIEPRKSAPRRGGTVACGWARGHAGLTAHCRHIQPPLGREFNGYGTARRRLSPVKDGQRNGPVFHSLSLIRGMYSHASKARRHNTRVAEPSTVDISCVRKHCTWWCGKRISATVPAAADLPAGTVLTPGVITLYTRRSSSKVGSGLHQFDADDTRACTAPRRSIASRKQARGPPHRPQEQSVIRLRWR
jgi:hypothetical protein